MLVYVNWHICAFALFPILAMAENVTLNWQTFSEHLQMMFKELYQEERYADVTLVSDDQTQFKAHKMVLSACSPVFKKIIDNNPSQHPLIYLRGIQSYEMESILQFMYLGEAKFYYERMAEFINVANSFEVKEICKQRTERTRDKQVPLQEYEKHNEEKDEIKEVIGKIENKQTDQDIEKVPDNEEQCIEESMSRISKKDIERSSEDYNDEENRESSEHFEAKRELEAFENDQCEEKTKDSISTAEIIPNT